MSGYADEHFSHENKEVTPGRFLQKPFSADQLFDKIKEVLSIPQ